MFSSCYSLVPSISLLTTLKLKNIWTLRHLKWRTFFHVACHIFCICLLTNKYQLSWGSTRLDLDPGCLSCQTEKMLGC